MKRYYQATYGKEYQFNSEERLLIWIIIQAIKDAYLLNCRTGQDKGYQRDALRWICSKSMRPFSYKWICEKLGLDLYKEDVVLKELKIGVKNLMEYRMGGRKKK